MPPPYYKRGMTIPDAYFAGIIDGEGHVGLHARSGKKYVTSMVPVVEVKMTDKAVILALKERFGGSFWMKKPGLPHHKVQWRWRVQDRTAGVVISALREFLIVKAKDADAIMDYLATSEERKRRSPAVLRERRAATARGL